MKRAQQAGDEWARIFALQIMVGMQDVCTPYQPCGSVLACRRDCYWSPGAMNKCNRA
jgi:hypothetical protein